MSQSSRESTPSPELESQPFVRLINFARNPPATPPVQNARPKRKSATRFGNVKDATLIRSAVKSTKTAYSFFVDERRNEDHSSASGSNISSLRMFYRNCRAAWNALPLDEKTRFFQLSALDKIKANREQAQHILRPPLRDVRIPIVDFVRHLPSPPPVSYRRHPIRHGSTRFKVSKHNMRYPYRRLRYNSYSLPLTKKRRTKSAFSFFTDQRKVDTGFNGRGLTLEECRHFFDECEDEWENLPIEMAEKYYKLAEIEKIKYKSGGFIIVVHRPSTNIAQRHVPPAPNPIIPAPIRMQEPVLPIRTPFTIFSAHNLDTVQERFPNRPESFHLRILLGMWERESDENKDECYEQFYMDCDRFLEESTD